MPGRVMLAAYAIVSLWLAAPLAARAGEALDINGAFVGEGLPKGWSPNKPGYWDDEGKVVLTPIPDLEKSSVRLTSVTRAMSLYCTTRFAVEGGDKVVLRALMRGSGAGSLGVYYYPAGGWLKREFQASEEWMEYSAELPLPEKVSQISVVIGIPPRASTEFLDLTAEVVRSGR